MFATILTVFLIGNFPVLEATHPAPQPRFTKEYISQNLVNNTVSIESIYISEEGTNLGWIIRIKNSVVAIDANGSLIRILNRAADTRNDNTVEYYTSGIEQGKLMRIGNTYFQYYNGGVERGKISSIGNLYFQYYSNGGIENGKIRCLGNIYFQYVNTGSTGIKLQSIGEVYFTYNNNGTIQRISGNQVGVNIQTTSIEQWRVTLGLPPQPYTQP